MEKITAKFNSKCSGTGQQLKKGEQIFYDRQNKKAYHITNLDAQKRYEEENERQSVNGMIEAQENAYFDNLANR